MTSTHTKWQVLWNLQKKRGNIHWEPVSTRYWGWYLERPKFSPMSNMRGCYTGTEVKVLPVPWGTKFCGSPLVEKIMGQDRIAARALWCHNPIVYCKVVVQICILHYAYLPLLAMNCTIVTAHVCFHFWHYHPNLNLASSPCSQINKLHLYYFNIRDIFLYFHIQHSSYDDFGEDSGQRQKSFNLMGRSERNRIIGI